MLSQIQRTATPQPVGSSARNERRFRAAGRVALGQQQRAQLAFPIRIAPEQIESGVEEVAFVRRADQ